LLRRRRDTYGEYRGQDERKASHRLC
jgi:hypothetical protein